MSQVGFINYEIVGTPEPFPIPVTRAMNKKFDNLVATDKEIARGFLMAFDPADTTKKELVIAKATAEKPFYFCIGYALKPVAGTDNFFMTDTNFTVVGALQSDPKVNALYSGNVAGFIDGIVQPGQQLMPADGSTTHGGSAEVLGHMKAWDGSNRKTICGIYLGRVGQSDGKWVATATTDVIGTIGKIQFNGGIG